MRIYVAGPIRVGNRTENIIRAIRLGDELLNLGHTPYVPHAVCALWQTVAPRSEEDWIRFDLAWLRQCDAVIRIEGESAGADQEVTEACRLGIPVYYSVAELLQAQACQS